MGKKKRKKILFFLYESNPNRLLILSGVKNLSSVFTTGKEPAIEKSLSDKSLIKSSNSVVSAKINRSKPA